MGTNDVSRTSPRSVAAALVALATVTLLVRRCSRTDQVATDGGTNSNERRSGVAAVRSLRGARTDPDAAAASGRRPLPTAVQFELGDESYPVEERIARYRSRQSRR